MVTLPNDAPEKYAMFLLKACFFTIYLALLLIKGVRSSQ